MFSSIYALFLTYCGQTFVKSVRSVWVKPEENIWTILANYEATVFVAWQVGMSEDFLFLARAGGSLGPMIGN